MVNAAPADPFYVGDVVRPHPCGGGVGWPAMPPVTPGCFVRVAWLLFAGAGLVHRDDATIQFARTPAENLHVDAGHIYKTSKARHDSGGGTFAAMAPPAAAGQHHHAASGQPSTWCAA